MISLTAEAALFTDTKISGKGATSLDDTDVASIQVWAEVDGDGIADTGDEAYPGTVTLAERMQTLKGRLSSNVTSACDADNNTLTPDVLCWENVPEEVELILDTTEANGFNFLALNVGPGEHTIKVYATLSTSEQSLSGEISADPKAAVGKRTIIVQEVQLIQDATI